MIDSALPERQGLYNPANEHDACGVGFVAHIKGGKSHSIVEQGLQILKNLDHRGAVGADPLMGDGAGILIQIPHDYFHEVMAAQGVTLPRAGDYGVGMVFLPKESASRLACQEEIERAVRAEGQVVLGWRDVPVNHTMPMSPAVPTARVWRPARTGHWGETSRINQVKRAKLKHSPLGSARINGGCRRDAPPFGHGA